MTGRIEGFVEAMHIRPDDRVLEIGCGHGVAASLVCRTLRTGCYVAVDRSRKMIAAAAQRNAAHVRAGLASFVLAELETLDLGNRQFDKIFALRVRLFHDEPDRAHALASRWLAPTGQLFVEYDVPAARAASRST